MSRLQKGRISCCKIIEAHLLRTQCTILEIFLLEDRAAHAEGVPRARSREPCVPAGRGDEVHARAVLLDGLLDEVRDAAGFEGL